MPRYYEIIMHGNTLDRITEDSVRFAYAFVSLSLRQHRIEGKNGEFETFAVEFLAHLQKYWYVYTTPPEAPSPE
jgi:hypothetical protein